MRQALAIVARTLYLAPLHLLVEGVEVTVTAAQGSLVVLAAVALIQAAAVRLVVRVRLDRVMPEAKVELRLFRAAVVVALEQ